MPFPAKTLFPGTETFPEAGAEVPTGFSELGDMLYESLAPTWTEPDEDLGFPLRTFCDALMAQGQGLRDQVKEVGDRPGYGVLMSPDECPPDALLYLAQLAGVDLNQLYKGIVILARNEAINPSFEHDAVASITPYGWEKELVSEATWEAFAVSSTWAGPGGGRSLHMKAKHNGTTNGVRIGPRMIKEAAKMVPCKFGDWISIQALVNIISAAGGGFNIEVTWYKADGSTLVSNSGVLGEHLVGVTGIHEINTQFEVPEHAAFSRVAIYAGSKVANQVIEYYLDDIVVTIEETKPSLPLTYVDGDQPGCSWSGAPGQSKSFESREETEEEFFQQQRNRIKELPNNTRGTPASIIRAAQQYLIGDKTVFFTERAGGSPWKVSVVTFLEETPNPQQVKESIENFLPAGIILEYESVPETSWSIIRAEYATWKAVKEAFVTWNGVRDNIPGT
jgi:hypothetical protein